MKQIQYKNDTFYFRVKNNETFFYSGIPEGFRIFSFLPSLQRFPFLFKLSIDITDSQYDKKEIKKRISKAIKRKDEISYSKFNLN